MNNDLLDRAAELNRAGTAFVFATVVRAEKPTSAKPGASAIITGDGALTGWVGGSYFERHKRYRLGVVSESPNCKTGLRP